MDQKTTIAVIGLGYVGLPLAVEFGKNFRTIGFDLKKEIIENYKNQINPKGGLSTEQLKSTVFGEYTADPSEITKAVYINVAVSTPVNEARISQTCILLSQHQNQLADI